MVHNLFNGTQFVLMGPWVAGVNCIYDLVNKQKTMNNRIKNNTATPFDAKYKEDKNLPE